MSNAKVFANIQTGLSELVPAFVDEFLPRVQRRTPVRTGTLRDGWTSTSSETTATISNEVPYAPFIEYGTRYIAPVGMLRATVEESEQILEIAKRKVGLE